MDEGEGKAAAFKHSPFRASSPDRQRRAQARASRAGAVALKSCARFFALTVLYRLFCLCFRMYLNVVSASLGKQTLIFLNSTEYVIVWFSQLQVEVAMIKFFGLRNLVALCQASVGGKFRGLTLDL